MSAPDHPVANVFGGPHEHVFTSPFRGYLMCSNGYCAEMTTVDGQPLTDEQNEALRATILVDHSPGASRQSPI